MNRKIENIIRKMHVKSKENLEKESESKERNFYLTNYIYLNVVISHLQNLDLRQNFQDIILLQPYCLISSLNYIEISSKDVATFLKWYYRIFVTFYSDYNNKEKYKMLNSRFVDNIVKYAFQKKLEISGTPLLCFNNINVPEYVESLGNSFDEFFKFANSLEKKFTFFTAKSESFFLESGLNKTILDDAVLWDNEHNAVVSNQKSQTLNCSEKKNEKKSPLKEISNKKTSSEKKDNSLRREMLQLFNAYFDIENMTCKQYCDKEIMEKILIFAKEFYPNLVNLIKKQISLYNKEQEIGQYKIALEEIYYNEPSKVNVLLNLQQFCSQTEIEPQYLGYIPTLKMYLDQIYAYLQQFIAKNDNILIPDYYEYIEEIFKQIVLFLPYLPINFEELIRN